MNHDGGRRGAPREAALDGIRAVAVGVVLLFHLGVRWMPGGYLGVSVFFTLSGYLITTLLLTELQGSGRIAFSAFAARRARRLLPANLMCVSAIVIAVGLGEFSFVPEMRAGLLGAVLQVSNWVSLVGSTSYRSLFLNAPAVTSPLTHFWSLAIEAQFYLVWPLVLAGMWRMARRSVSRLVLLLGGLVAVMFGVSRAIALLSGPDAAYWATPARLGELLVGGVCGALVLQWRPKRRAWGWLAVVAMIVVLVCCMTFSPTSGPAFDGDLTLFALVSAALLVGVTVDGPVRSMLSWRPLVAIGEVSYGLYLFHWPVFVLLRQHGWNLTRWFDAVVALAITTVLTLMSYWLVERPVRRLSWRPRRVALVAPLLVGAVLMAALTVPVGRGFLEVDTKALQRASIDSAVPAPLVTKPSLATSTTVGTITSGPIQQREVVLPLPSPPSRPVRILVVGDSTAFYVGQALAQWSVDHPNYMAVGMRWCQGCGFLLDGTITSFDGASFVERSRRVMQVDVPAAVLKLHPDVVMLMSTVDDVANRQWTNAEGPLSPRDSLFRQRMTTAYQTMTRSLLDLRVPHVVWVLPPVPTSKWSTPEMGEADRYAIQHSVISEVATAAGPNVVVADMDGWLTSGGHADDAQWRPDGTHLSETSARRLVDRWCAPLLMGIALR